jgi:hypothetical protein
MERKLHASCSGIDGRHAELREVVIENERLRNVQPFHDREGHRVGEGEILIGVLRNNLTRSLFIPHANADHRYATAVNLVEEASGNATPETREKQGVDFREDKVGRKKGPVIARQTAGDLHGCRMIHVA